MKRKLNAKLNAKSQGKHIYMRFHSKCILTFAPRCIAPSRSSEIRQWMAVSPLQLHRFHVLVYESGMHDEKVR